MLKLDKPAIKPTEIKPERIEEFRKTIPSKAQNKDFRYWIAWWENHFTTEDYLKFLSLQVKCF